MIFKMVVAELQMQRVLDAQLKSLQRTLLKESMDERRVKVPEIAEIIDILYEKLLTKKLCARGEPQLLTVDQKGARKEMFASIRERR